MNRKKNIDLVVINPGNRVEIYQILGSSGLSAAEPPIWSGLMAAYMEKKNYSVAIIDANAEMLTPAQTAKRVQELCPLLVAVVVYGHNPSASTQVMPSAGRICKAIKDLTPDQKVLLVGGHVASLPERTLREEAADFVCTGEGPVTLSDLTECLRSTEYPDYKNVRGLTYENNDETVTTPPAPNITNLDEEMPGMYWHLLPMHLYKAHGWHCLGYPTRRPYASIYTTLGCPYKCEFCCIQAPFKSGEAALNLKPAINSYRYWNPKFVIKQIKHLVENYGIKHIKIADEMFDLNPRHCNPIYEGLVNEGFGDWLNMWAYSRVDTVKDEKTVELSLRAGLRWYALGIESASEKVLGNVDKKGYNIEDTIKTVDKLRKTGVSVQANYIMGLPEDNLETMQETLNLAIKLNTEWINVYSTMAYPGSRLYERATREGWALPENWIGFSQHSIEGLPLPTKYLTAGQVLTFQDYFHKAYFSRPEYIKMLEKKFGPLAVKHVRKVLSKNLIRKNAEPIPGITIPEFSF